MCHEADNVVQELTAQQLGLVAGDPGDPGALKLGEGLCRGTKGGLFSCLSLICLFPSRNAPLPGGL